MGVDIQGHSAWDTFYLDFIAPRSAFNRGESFHDSHRYGITYGIPRYIPRAYLRYGMDI